jgi:hypothetical protein
MLVDVNKANHFIQTMAGDFKFKSKLTDFLVYLSWANDEELEWLDRATEDLRKQNDRTNRYWCGMLLRFESHINHILKLADVFFDELDRPAISDRLLTFVEIGQKYEFKLTPTERVQRRLVLAKLSRNS